MAMLFFDAGLSSNTWSTNNSLINTSGLSNSYGAAVFNLGTPYGRFSGCPGLQFLNNVYGASLTSAASIIVPNTQTLFASASYYFTGSTASTSTVIQFSDVNVAQISFCLNPIGQILIYNNTTLLATSVGALSWNNWHRIECMVTISTSAGVATCNVDGAQFVTFSGSTQHTSNAYANQIFFGSGVTTVLSGATSTQATDFLVYNSTSTSPNTFLGDKRIIIQQPVGDGVETSWTANWASFANSTSYVVGQQLLDSNGNVQRCTTAGTSAASGAPTWLTTVGTTTISGGATFTCEGAAANYKAVNEAPSDGDSSYLLDGTVGDKEGFAFSPLSPLVTGIVGVGIVAYARKDDSGVRSIQLGAQQGSNIAVNGTNLIMLSSYASYQAFFPVDPSTTNPWTVPGVNSATLLVETTQ